MGGCGDHGPSELFGDAPRPFSRSTRGLVTATCYVADSIGGRGRAWATRAASKRNKRRPLTGDRRDRKPPRSCGRYRQSRATSTFVATPATSRRRSGQRLQLPSEPRRRVPDPDPGREIDEGPDTRRASVAQERSPKLASCAPGSKPGCPRRRTKRRGLNDAEVRGRRNGYRRSSDEPPRYALSAGLACVGNTTVRRQRGAEPSRSHRLSPGFLSPRSRGAGRCRAKWALRALPPPPQRSAPAGGGGVSPNRFLPVISVGEHRRPRVRRCPAHEDHAVLDVGAINAIALTGPPAPALKWDGREVDTSDGGSARRVRRRPASVQTSGQTLGLSDRDATHGTVPKAPRDLIRARRRTMGMTYRAGNRPAATGIAPLFSPGNVEGECPPPGIAVAYL